VSAALLVTALRDPGSVALLDGAGWSALLSAARAEVLLGTLALRLSGQPMPDAVRDLLDAAARAAAQAQVQALWEAEMARRALAPLGVEVMLLKGTAYAAAGMDAALGRQIGDLDILLPRAALDDAERLLRAAGWEWVKDDAYDQLYYRRWMHELPPLIHAERDRMIDVHHAILPLTHRIRPDMPAMLADARALPHRPGLAILSPPDMLCHAAAHLMADGDLAGGLRNLWDVDRMLRAFAGGQADFWAGLTQRAQHHGLLAPVQRAARLAHRLYATPIPQTWRVSDSLDPLMLRRLMARDGWGREGRALTRFAFYLRGHAMRMPPGMLARHLWTKWRKA
jgi:hypothetical protein